MSGNRRAYQRLGLVILIFVLMSMVQSIWLPLHKAPDEIAHFQYSRFIAKYGGRLPAIRPISRRFTMDWWLF